MVLILPSKDSWEQYESCTCVYGICTTFVNNILLLFTRSLQTDAGGKKKEEKKSRFASSSADKQMQFYNTLILNSVCIIEHTTYTYYIRSFQMIRIKNLLQELYIILSPLSLWVFGRHYRLK